MQRLGEVSALDLGTAFLPTENILDPALANLRRTVTLDGQLVSNISEPANTALELRSLTRYLNNPFIRVFTGLCNHHAHMLAEESEDLDISTAMSAEGADNTLEQESEEILHRLMETILLYFSSHTQGKDWLRRFGLPTIPQHGLLI